ncbi:putative membrane protein DUF2232 [Hoeflea marina]|uniref:Putative membrane protein DUF2232 n=1 Tax=Hoeflea marina TaxID=274592 RepID=A0A317PNU8_9HYPH|nr:DUF2232 domain-containing protein [Hoeflea marina]PWW02253.1 putative membrane protein DUF2232 [Hoeflea marina]
MPLQTTSILVGLLAGLSTALLLVSAGMPSLLSIFLAAAATMPVLIAGLGWSNLASGIAVVSAAAIVAMVTAPLAAGVTAVTTLLPAAWMAHLSNLARPAEELGGEAGAVIWYPLPDMLLRACVVVVLGLCVLGYAVGYGPELVERMVDALVKSLGEGNAEFQPGAEAITEIKGFTAYFIPIVQGATGVIVLMASLYLAAAIVRLSGRSKRPRDDVPMQLRMPRGGIFAFVAGLALTFAGGPLAYVGWAIVGAFGAGFALAGFAILHALTRGKPWRGMALWLTYVSVVLFTVPLILFLFLGLADTARSSGSSNQHPRT